MSLRHATGCGSGVLVVCYRLCGLQAQSMDAQALEGVFSICQADIHAKQHSFDRAAALLDAAKIPLACSPRTQLCSAAHASAVRATMHRLQGDHQGAVQHCQAGIQLASRALLESLRNGSGDLSEMLQPGQSPAKGCSKQASCDSRSAQSSAKPSCSGVAERKAEEVDHEVRSAPQSAWQVRSQLARLHISMAELLREAGDRAGAGSCLQAARHACCNPVPGSGSASEAFPVQMAAALYQEAAMQLEQQELVSPPSARVWCRYVWPCTLLTLKSCFFPPETELPGWEVSSGPVRAPDKWLQH